MRGVAAALSGLPLGTALYAAAGRRLPRPRRPTRRQRPLLGALCASAVAEELVWRGALLRVLGARGRVLSIGVTTVGFATGHLPHAGRRALATYGLLGAVLGVVAGRRGGLGAAVVAHATYDVLAFLEEVPP